MIYIFAFLVALFAATPALADPVTIGVAALTAAASTGAAYAAGTIAASAIFATFATKFAISVGLSFISSALTPKPKGGAEGFVAPVGQTGYTVAQISPASDHAVIYGQSRIGGVVVYKEVTNGNKYLHMVVALAGHECEEITSIYLDDEILTLDDDGNATEPSKYNGKVRVKGHLGDPNQTADTFLIDESDGKWTADHRLRGICYVYIRLQFDADSFPNGEPAMSFLVKGKKVYNPNTDTTAWSDNSALCLRDYLASNYGLNTTDIDDTLFSAAANICDEDIDLDAGGTEKRYTTHGSFLTSDKPIEVIDALLRAMGGTIWYAQGKWRVKAAAYTAPVITFDEDDLRSPIKIGTRHSRRENFNTVRGTFKGPETNYVSSDYPQIASDEFVNIDGGDVSVIDFDLPYTNSASRAQRIAKLALYRNREQLSVSASFGMRAFQVQIGDIVKMTNSRAGWTEKTFEVVNWTFYPNSDQSLVIDLDLREISSAVFDWDAEETAFEANNTTLFDPFDVPSLGVNVASEARVINEHLTNVIVVTTTTLFPERVDQVEVQFKLSSESNYRIAGFGEVGIVDILDVQDNSFDIRARAINTFGIKGAFTTVSGFTVENLADPPADVSDFSFNAGPSGVLLEWEAVPDLDLSFYRIRHSFVESGATFGSSVTAVDKVARPANSVLVPPQSGTYLIKAYDKSGNQSVNAATVVIRAEDLDTYGTTQRLTEHPTFSGSKTGCSIADGRLRITDPSTASSSATYDFSTYIDTGSVRVARCAMEIENIRIDDAATVTFDTLTGNFDSLPGLFDDLSGGTQFSDTNVIQYVATTDDDPAGTPTWSAYKRFKAGDFSARAFKFRVELQSTSADVTPALAQLAATVRY
ncbi:MAG: hypothetical protein VW496_01185 [Pelagibacteraceae bacterium]